MRNKKHFFVITGGPGVGKTTLINELKKRGLVCIPEVAREIIKEQIESKGEALPWGNREAYAELMMKRSVEVYEKALRDHAERMVIFDRGIPDVLGYLDLIQHSIPVEYIFTAQRCLYAKKVFILPPWKEIYETDSERKQTFAEAEATFYALKKAYLNCHYDLLEVPKDTVEKRADFIQSLLS